MRQTAIQKGAYIEQDALTDSTGQESVLKILAYFDVFQYPLKKEEIGLFLDRAVASNLLDKWLEQLTAENKLFCYNDFYLLQNNPLLAHRRIQGNERADTLLVKALKIGRFLCQFPFVRAVGISGSLSKHFADERADIDFFIITKANRLWIARTLMHLFKKLTYLVGRQHFYCMNYYVDENALLLTEKNIFTAIELKTLLPVAGDKTIQQFFAANQWADAWLPACDPQLQQAKDPQASWFKRLGEWLFNNRIGDRIDNFLLRATTRRWIRKETKGKRNQKGQAMDLITDKHFARSNPGAFQEKVLSIYKDKLEKLHLL